VQRDQWQCCENSSTLSNHEDLIQECCQPNPATPPAGLLNVAPS
jgi:hypothetical protein